MASRGRRGGAPAREDEPRRDERTEQQAPTPPCPVLPPPPPVDYGVFIQGLVQAMQTQAHTQAALQAQLEAQTRLVVFGHRTLDEALSAACRQEGEMEQYLEEKKASQKRPAATFQRQDKKKMVYQTPQRSVVVGSTQRLPKTSVGSPARSASPSDSNSSASYRKTRKASSPSSSFARQLALESGIESEDLEVPLSVHTPAGMMKDYDAILGLDWLEEHYALVDCRRKRIVFRIPGEDEFSHPLPRNVAGKLVISAMKAMRMVSKGCDAFLASVVFVAQLSLRSSVLDEVIEQQGADPRLLELVGKAGIARDEDGVCWIIEEGFPDLDLLWRLLKNPEGSCLGD
ncbi:hypothetical protein Taro_012727 [Colocasia esculenta]|uniref:Reverse transcriptase domain-containing protein n=1 Tax=Colocasia esculenta TaxID=4460 RepID=A0A843UEC3_COLES|nr:hypothetical protein [Colocasia esculenta]